MAEKSSESESNNPPPDQQREKPGKEPMDTGWIVTSSVRDGKEPEELPG